jgi:hypothetical protein
MLSASGHGQDVQRRACGHRRQFCLIAELLSMAAGKEVAYLSFPDEGLHVLKCENKVRCSMGITEFCKQHLM